MGKLFRRGLIGVGAIAAALLLLSACGSSDSDSLTKAAFVRKGNTICGKWQQARGKQFAELRSKLKPSSTKVEREKVVFWFFQPYETATRELSQLPRPAGEEESVEAMIEAMEGATKRIKDDPIHAANDYLTFKKPNQLVEDYGLTECKV